MNVEESKTDLLTLNLPESPTLELRKKQSFKGGYLEVTYI